MSWTDREGLERGGSCNECGEPVEEEWHAYCPRCYAQEQGWDEPDPAPALTITDRRFERLLERLHDVEIRVARLEHRTGVWS